jgi:GPH family glycoside/pentoside/hexuronide:cation symporter
VKQRISQPLSPLRRFAYACGSPGFSVSDRIVVAVAFYFYLPPGDSDLPAQLPTEPLLFGLTGLGAAMLVARIFDSLADPVVGHFSDRSRARIGRRRVWMLLGIVPMCATPVLVFWPPGPPGSTQNWLWLTGLLSVYFVAFTAYVAPYLALQPELARSEPERVRLATLVGILTLPVAGVFGFGWTAMVDWGVGHGLSTEDAIRLLVVIASVCGFALCALPLLAVDERRHTVSRSSDLPFRRALFETLANRSFMLYLGAQILFIFGMNLLQPAVPYYAEVLLGRSLAFSAQLGGALFAGIILGFPVTGLLSRSLGAKRTMLTAVAFFGAALGIMTLIVPDVPGGPHDAQNLVIVHLGMFCAGIPISAFVILPNVLLGQIIDADEVRTGANRSAIYFGMQGLATKWVYGASAAALAALMSRYGNSIEEPLGVWLVSPVAGAACLMSALLYTLYPERAVKEAGHREPSIVNSGKEAVRSAE